MKFSSKYIGAFIILFVVSFLFAHKTQAAPSCVATTTGHWSDPTVWSGCHGVGGVPDITDYVGINSGAIVTIDDGQNITIQSLVIKDALAASNGITIAGNGSLTVTNITTGISINQSSGSGSSTINVGDGSLSAKSISLDGGATGISSVTVNAGTITTSGSIGFGGTALNAQLISTGASTINVGGDFLSGGTLTTSGTGTINFNGNAAQIIGSYATYNNIVIANTSGGVTSSGPVIIGGTLSVNSGTLESGLNNLTVTGTTTVANGGTLLFSGNADQTFNGDVTLDGGSIWNEIATPTIYFGGSFTDNSTSFTANTGQHIFTGVDKTISANDDTIDNFVVTGDLTNDGSLNIITDLSGSGTFKNGANGNLKITGAVTITNLDASTYGNTVKFNHSGNQVVRPVQYSFLGVKDGGTKTIGSGFTINVGLSVSSGTIADLTGISTTQFLFLGGVTQSIGTWGATGSGAANINDTYFSGTGTVVVTGPTTTVTINSLSADTGISATDFMTKTAVQTINASLSEPLLQGEVLYGSVDGGASYSDITSMVSGTTVAWTGATLNSGTNSITMKVSIASQDGPVASHSYTLDTTAPVITEVTPIPSPTTEGNAQYYFRTDKACELQVTPLIATGGGVQAVHASGHPVPGSDFYFSFSGLVDGGTYHFDFQCVDSSGNNSNTLHVGPFTATIPQPSSGGGGGGISVVFPFISPSIPKTSSVNTIYQFGRSLKFGSFGDDVKHLQAFLNTHNAQVTTSGDGSLGHEITIFGKATKSALAKYQKANNISATGFFGPITMKFVNGVLSNGK